MDPNLECLLYCIISFVFAIILVCVTFNVMPISRYNKIKKKADKYDELKKSHQDYIDSMKHYVEASEAVRIHWKDSATSALIKVEELEKDLAKEEKVADIFEGVIQWFVQSVEENKTSKAITYVKCLKAIEESRKIDSQNQKPDDSASTAGPNYFSPNEAPGKPL